jgi:hypothetical protein
VKTVFTPRKMKPNSNLIVYVVAAVIIGVALSNSSDIASLRELTEQLRQTVQAQITHPPRNALQTAQLTRILTELCASDLSPDSFRFIMAHLELQLNNVPTLQEIRDLIDILSQIENKFGNKLGSGNPGDMADYLSKNFPHGPGGGDGGGAAGGAVSP